MSIYFKYYRESKTPPNSDGFGDLITLEKRLRTYVMRCAIWYRLYNLKNVKKHLWRSVTFSLKVRLLHGCFSRF